MSETPAAGNRIYLCIDLKSFYASVECVVRGLDPLTTNLVVADASRTEKTICLAVSPSMKAHGIPGRARLFEVVQRVREVNALRRRQNRGRDFRGSSFLAPELANSPELELSYIVAPPQMAKYVEVSTQVYNTYLKYVAPEDIHVYSIDEVFMDITDYMKTLGLSARELAIRMIRDVLHTTGITATAGIGTNMYLAKIAMDIEAKHTVPDRDGVRIAELDEISYREKLWSHRPLTDFWRIGRGYASRLEAHGMFTMGDVARCSLGKPGEALSEELLYKLFGINAELLIDHAWGREPCTIGEVKAYRPSANSISSGQVLPRPYTCEGARLIVREMTELLSLGLVDKGLVTDQLVLSVGYDTESLSDPEIRSRYSGRISTDFYGRSVPAHAHGSRSLPRQTSSGRLIMEAMLELFDRIVDKRLLVRRVTLTANHVVYADSVSHEPVCRQLDLFTDYETIRKQRAQEDAELERERRRQQAVLAVKRRYGKNAILTGTNFEEGATTIERNRQIGGHRA